MWIAAKELPGAVIFVAADKKYRGAAIQDLLAAKDRDVLRIRERPGFHSN
jgi:hypothetical protein